MDLNERYTRLLDEQIARYGRETRWLEFKLNYQDADRLGQYISALSNGACLDREDFGYLYFGVADEKLAVEGTRFDAATHYAKGRQSLELYLRQYIAPAIGFEFEEFLYKERARVVRLKVPAAAGVPTTFLGKAYVRVDSHTTELTRYVDWTRAIYASRTDWSAQVVENATLDDLDPQAVAIARQGYKERFPQLAGQVEGWSDAVFLDKACLTLGGQITRATLLLVGKRESAFKLPHIAEIVWKCHQEGETFGDTYTIPFLRSTTELMRRIRNYRFKIYPQDSLIPAEVWKYDTRSILEALHNCIAHQDYTLDERIRVTEDRDRLTFENAGAFFDGQYDQYILGERTPRRYRNPALMKAMVSIKMIDSQGYGIHNLYLRQKERYLPMPDYEGSGEAQVVLHMPGAVIDPNYSLHLFADSDITLTEALLLDRVQKGERISGEAVDLLRRKALVEGRKPAVHVSRFVADTTGQRAEYSKHKGLNIRACEALLLEALADHGTLSREEIDKLLWDVVSDLLDDRQKKRRITNLLSKLREQGRITNRARGPRSDWMLAKSD